MGARTRIYLVRVGAEFSAAHVLWGYAGACERVHGHNFKVEVEIEARELDGIGMSLDYQELRRLLRGITDDLDHRMLNEVPPFTEVNPTAEHIAAYVYGRLGHLLQAQHGPRVRLCEVVVREDDHSSVTYRERG